MAQIKNLFIDQATTYSEYVQFIDNTKTPISLVGYTVRGQMQKSHTSANAAAIFALNIISNTTGNVNISLTAGDTANIPAGRYVYGIDAVSANISANGDNVFRIAEGIVTVNPATMAQGLPAYGGSAIQYPTNAYVNSRFASLTTANVPEQGNLYFTNARVYSNVVSLISNLSTSNIAEGNRLYFTNSRVISAFTAGNNISISANGLINVSADGANLVNGSNVFSLNYDGSLTFPNGSKILNSANDIVLSPKLTGTVRAPSITLPVGSLVEEYGTIEVIVEDLILDTVFDYSTGTGDTLAIGTIGNTTGFAHPWAIYKFTTTPSPALQVNDVIAGAAVPINSVVQFVGTGAYEKYIVTDKVFPLGVPVNGITVTTVRPVVNASLSISTSANTDVALKTGGGTGVIVTHSDIIPFNNNAESLGTPTKRFKQLWLGGGTIFIADDVLGIDLSIGARNGDLVVEGGAGLEVGQFVFRDNEMRITDANTEIFIGQIGAPAPVTFRRTIKVRNSSDEYNLLNVDQQGRITVLSEIATDPTQAAMSIVGARARDVKSPDNLGVLLQLTGSSTSPSRIYHDSYGTANYSAFIGRHARGNSTVSTQTLNGDIISRVGANPHDNDGFASISTMRMDFVNAEDQTNSGHGSKIELWTTPVGTTTISKNITFSEYGANLTGNTAGITFSDSSRQTTAWTGTTSASNITGLATVATTGNYSNLINKPVIVSNITAGTGILVNTNGANVSIDSTGIQNIAAANGAGQIGVSYSGPNVTLTLPQAISTSSSVTFQDLIVNGTFTAANINISTAPTIAGKLLLLAANATSNAGLSGGGIILGPLGNAFTRSFTYDLAANKWDTDGAGLNTLELSSDNLIVTGGAHFGNAYNDYDFPNSTIQIDGNENTYLQHVIKNHSTGSQASADYIAVNNIGDDTSNYIDMGINSSTYNNLDYSITGPNDGYLYVSDGDLVIGTATNGKEIVFFTGGTTSDKQRASISDSGLSTIELAVYGNTNITGNTTVANISVTNNLIANTGNFTSLAVTNTISGTVANGVVTTGSYSNPTWITGLAGAKITGFVANAINANTVTNGVYTTDVGTVTNVMLSGNITNSKLVNSNIIINTGNGISGGGTVALGGNITLVNTDLGSSQSIFKTISVSGQSNVTANINNDTATFIAGTNMSITTSGKSITFNYTAGNVVPVTNISGANNIILSGSTGNVTIQRIDGLQNVVTGNAASTYSLSETDQYFGSTRSITGACTVTLPTGSSVSAGKQYIIKDEGGGSGSGSKRITISASGSDTIDGSATRTITSNYGALTVLWTGTRWSVI